MIHTVSMASGSHMVTICLVQGIEAVTVLVAPLNDPNLIYINTFMKYKGLKSG